MAGTDWRRAKGDSVIRRGTAIVGLFGAWVAVLSGQSQPSVFRADADTVAVNVSVKRNNLPVLGLTAADFRLYDNDVLQRVAAVSMDAVPVDVSFVVDLSPSVFLDLASAREAVRRMATFLKPADRFRVLTMGNSVVNAVPWQPAGPPDTSRIQGSLGHISLVADSMVLALLHRTDPDRRHLVVALTDGQDICSLAPGASVRRGAERSGAVFHWVNLKREASPLRREGNLMTVSPDYFKNMYARSDGVESECKNPPPGGGGIDLERFLSDAARLTGGSAHTAWSGDDATGIALFFDAILDDFRRSYVLHYVPEGVSREGWHRLRVDVQGRGLRVRARTGYWGTVTAAAPPIPARR
jgi:VWFA-related protein